MFWTPCRCPKQLYFLLWRSICFIKDNDFSNERSITTWKFKEFQLSHENHSMMLTLFLLEKEPKRQLFLEAINMMLWFDRTEMLSYFLQAIVQCTSLPYIYNYIYLVQFYYNTEKPAIMQRLFGVMSNLASRYDKAHVT